MRIGASALVAEISWCAMVITGGLRFEILNVVVAEQESHTFPQCLQSFVKISAGGRYTRAFLHRHSGVEIIPQEYDMPVVLFLRQYTAHPSDVLMHIGNDKAFVRGYRHLGMGNFLRGLTVCNAALRNKTKGAAWGRALKFVGHKAPSRIPAAQASLCGRSFSGQSIW